LPPGQTISGGIHFHWLGSKDRARGTGDDNRTFSSADRTINSSLPGKYMYVLGCEGTLWGSYPLDMPNRPDGFPDSRAGSEVPLAFKLYQNPQYTGKAPCYKQ